VGSPPTFIALTVAGFDPTCGAGVAGDLKTFAAHGVVGTAVLCAVAAQNSKGVSRVHAIPTEDVAAQWDAVLADVRPHAVKTGMLFSPAAAHLVAERMRDLPDVPLVVDPVLCASAGGALAAPGLLEAVRDVLSPRATLVTPNLDEAAAFLGRPVSPAGAEDAARALLSLLRCSAVLLKGGHAPGPATDVLATARGVVRWTLPRIDTPHAHGTGCALSASIAARLARGVALEGAVRGAKAYVHRALAAAGPLGSARGSVRHDVPADDGE
jgi:hydroxymethylpyrimidine/phosphomethylpyrimidine kinase